MKSAGRKNDKAGKRKGRTDLKPEKELPENSAQKRSSNTAEEEKISHSEPEKHHPNSKGYNIPYYSRNRNEHGTGQFGGQGYSSRGGYGRRG